MVVAGRIVKKLPCIVFVCLKPSNNHRLLEVKLSKSLPVLIFCLKTFKNCWVFLFMEHHAAVLDTSGLANLCCYRRGGFRATPGPANKSVLVQVWWLQGQHTCVGAYKIQSNIFGEGQIMSWIPGWTLNDKLFTYTNSATLPPKTNKYLLEYTKSKATLLVRVKPCLGSQGRL